MLRYTRLFLPGPFAMFLWLTAARAQTYNGGLRGSVQDASGAVVADATVTLADEATHQTRETRTDAPGLYVFNALRPATYSLHVSVANFSPADRLHIAVATQDFVTPNEGIERGRMPKTNRFGYFPKADFPAQIDTTADLAPDDCSREKL